MGHVVRLSTHRCLEERAGIGPRFRAGDQAGGTEHGTCQYRSSRRRVATIQRPQWPTECSISPTEIVSLRPRNGCVSDTCLCYDGGAWRTRQAGPGLPDPTTEHECSVEDDNAEVSSAERNAKKTYCRKDCQHTVCIRKACFPRGTGSTPGAQPEMLLQGVIRQAGQPGHDRRYK